jgi:GTP-binding protein EngB required for normal cell division
MKRVSDADLGGLRTATSVDIPVASLARAIAQLPDCAPELAERARRLAARVEAQRFHIAVLGEFKRGKSTLVNALIGAPLLPTGVVPVTTVATEVQFASPRPEIRVILADDEARRISPAELQRYVSEHDNPGNRLGVRRVELEVETVLGAPGVVLVDTPGVASVHEHQTRAAHEVLAESDGAVVVLSADAPLSQSEERLLSALADRGGRVFVVVNKSDHLSCAELHELHAFLSPQLVRLLGAEPSVYFTSARRALETSGTDHEHGDPGFSAFRHDLESFLRDDLAAARAQAGATELGRLASTLSQSVIVERAAATFDVDALEERLARFRTAAAAVRRDFAADRLVLEHDVEEIASSVGSALAAGAAQAPARAWPQIEEVVQGLRGRALDRALDDAVARAVEDAFDPLRRAVEVSASAAWERAIARFTERLRERIVALCTAANTLFEVHLPDPVLPSVAEQHARFSYHFLQVESPGTSLARGLRAALPTERSRRKTLERARRRLASELDKHAGRARFDLVQRLDEVSRRFFTALSSELEQTESSILEAATRAQQALESTEAEQAAHEARRAHALALAHEAAQLAGTTGAPARDGSARDAPARDGSARDGSARDGSARDGRSDLDQTTSTGQGW